MRFLGPPWCAACALPLDHDRGEGACCAACLETPPAHTGARAAVAYGPVPRDVALKLKYGGRLAAAETMARLMLRLMLAATAAVDNADGVRLPTTTIAQHRTI